MNKKAMLLILDGFGEGKPEPTNAIYAAKTPFIDGLREQYPVTFLEPGGAAVGILDTAFGSSGVGHTTIGTGTLAGQPIKIIDDAVKDRTFFQNKNLLGAIEHAKKRGTNLHILGMGSDSFLHAYTPFLYALLDLCVQENFPGDRVFLHLATDGRDTDPDDARTTFVTIEDECRKRNLGRLASIFGRFYFDRGLIWERTEAIYDVFTRTDQPFITDWKAYLEEDYAKDIWDQFHAPMALGDENGPFPRMSDGDAVITMNFREDRGRQITGAIAQSDFEGFPRKKTLQDLYYVGMISYDEALTQAKVAFEKEKVTTCLAEVLDTNGYRHYHIAGREKYIFMTYNFNRSQELNLPLQTNVKAPQTKEVDTFDENPEMSTPCVADMLLEELEKGDQDVYLVNFENCDQVGHTGNLPAAIEAVESVDFALSRVIPAALEKGFEIIVTADHGNADEMVDEEGRPHTAHTYNKVPFILVSDQCQPSLRGEGTLADIAPTILDLLGLDVPGEMTGRSLLSN